MTTEHFNKLADALESYTGDGHGYQVDDAVLREAARILRAAAAVDVDVQLNVVAYRDGGTKRCSVKAPAYWVRPEPMVYLSEATEALIQKDLKIAELESALRMALAAREGFVLVPSEGVEQIADALADVLATFQHAEPEALKAAIQHSNRSAHAAYTLVYGLLAAAPKGTP